MLDSGIIAFNNHSNPLCIPFHEMDIDFRQRVRESRGETQQELDYYLGHTKNMLGIDVKHRTYTIFKLKVIFFWKIILYT